MRESDVKPLAVRPDASQGPLQMGDAGSVQTLSAPDEWLKLENAGPDTIPQDSSTSATLAIGGSDTGFVSHLGDYDWYRVDLVAGQSYVFNMGGGSGTPLEDPYLELYSPSGALIALDDDAGPGRDAMLRFTAQTTGTYFLNARAWAADTGHEYVGSYTISANFGPPQNPLESINLHFSAPGPVINVYFATAGETFQGMSAQRNWAGNEIAAAMAAFATYTDFANISMVQVGSAAGAEFILVLADLEPGTLGQFLTTGGVGYGGFDPGASGWNTNGLLPGGQGFITLMHEFGHGLGLGHPHDNSGNDEVMEGVTSEFNSYGTHGLNRGIFTTMTYNQGYPGVASGLQATPGPLDIALIQQKYGANTTANLGDTVYTLANGPFYAIWDSGGTDSIAYSGNGRVTIDLRAATLLNEVGGGGFVSRIIGNSGGFTIAAGVVIENATGGSLNDTLIGNSANNVLTGNDDNDTLTGNDGDDTLLGGDGADDLNGGAGADTMTGGTGNDAYFLDALDTITELPGEGTDTINESFATYTLPDNFEALVLLDGAVDGTGNSANNTILGNIGNNRLDGGAGADTLSGLSGDDFLIVDNSGDIANGGGGYDIVETTAVTTSGIMNEVEEVRMLGGALSISLTGVQTGMKVLGNGNDNTITGGVATDEIHGGAGVDFIHGWDGGDTLYGDDGNDTLWGRMGADHLDGGAGIDTASYAMGPGVTVNLTNPAVNTEHAAGDVYVSIESVLGSDFDDQITGNSVHNVLQGGDGNDSLFGGAGDDDLDGGSGADLGSMDYRDRGAALEFTLLASNTLTNPLIGGVAAGSMLNIERAQIFGTIFDDLVIGSSNADSFDGGSGADRLYGNGGADFLFGGDGNDVITGNDGNDSIGGWDGFDWLEGGEGADWISAGSGDDRLDGAAGNDTLDGQAGWDTMYGGLGDDVYYVDDAGDDPRENSGEGFDIVFTSVTWAIRPNIETVFLAPGAGGIIAFGDAVGNVLVGNEVANVVAAYGGNDWIEGRGGNDWLEGWDGDDRIEGGDGADRVDGGAGSDVLIGGANDDSFVYNAISDSSVASYDSIRDFQIGVDKVNLTAVRTGGADSFHFVYAYGNTYLFVDIGGGGDDMLIELTGTPGATASDLIWS